MSYDIDVTWEKCPHCKETGHEDVGGYTYNCAPMFFKALSFANNTETGLRDLSNMNCGDMRELLEGAVMHMSDPANVEEYKTLNPSNGWGDYESALKFLEKILDACKRHPTATISVS